MNKSFVVASLAIAGFAVAAPAEAFWPRSQLRACSEGVDEADFQRWRCWELDGQVQVPMSFGPAIAPYPGATGRNGPWHAPRRGAIVRRLG